MNNMPITGFNFIMTFVLVSDVIHQPFRGFTGNNFRMWVTGFHRCAELLEFNFARKTFH